MQFMYLRSKSKKNPGRHPFGMIGVQKHESGGVDVAIQMIHSTDRFDKEVGRHLLAKKINKDRVAVVAAGDPALHLGTILPRGASQRLDDYVRHQEILNKLIKDELEGGSWSTQAKKV